MDQYFSNQLSPVECRILSAMQSEVQRTILVVLVHRGSLTLADLQSSTGVPRSTLSFHLRNLLGRGLVVGDPTGIATHYQISSPGDVERLYRQYHSGKDTARDRFASVWGGLVRD